MTSKAQIEATNRYIKKAYDRIIVTVPKGDREKLKAAAEAEGKSLNKYITDRILA